MFSFFRSKSKQAFQDFSFIGIDIHSHLLPGVDDGATDTNNSLELIKGLRDLGFGRIITSPHVMAGHYPNTSQKLNDVGNKLSKTIQSSESSIDFHFSAEYYLDEHFETLLLNDDLLPMPGKHLLFELSFVAAPPQLEEVVFQLKIKRYKPILAHPERYLYWSHDFSKYERLKDMGCLLQLNLLSVIGTYGPKVAKNAKKMLKANLFDLAGTDTHNIHHIEQMKLGLANGGFYYLNNYPFQNKVLFQQKSTANHA